MSIASWNDEYTTHAAWGAIQDTLTYLSGIETDDEEEGQTLERISQVLRLVSEWRETPTLLVSPQMLDELKTAVDDNVKSPLENWQANDNAAYLESAYENLHSVLVATRGWPPTKDRYGRAISATMKQVAHESEEALESLRQSVEDIRTRLEEQLELGTQKLDEQDRAATESLTELQAAVEQATTSLAQLEATISRDETRLDNALTKQQEAFTNAETDRLQAHQEALKSSQSEFETALDEAVEDSKKRLAGQEESGNEVLNRLRTLEEQARNVVGAVATASTSTGYGTHAARQGRAALWLRLLAILLFLTAFAIAGYSVYLTETEEESWRVVVVRSVTSLTLLAAAGYAARESSHHRKEEIRARNTQLKLVALDPFIANLEKENREQLKMATAQHLFIDEDDGPPMSNQS